MFSNKLFNAEKTIELKRNELYLIKKFLLVSIIRSKDNEEFLQVERKFYDKLKEDTIKFYEEKGLKYKETESNSIIDPPFEEKIIDGETTFDYWMRTLNVILDTDGTPQEILKHPDKTYPAYRWSRVIYSGYIAFWDSEYVHDEYVITDIGMTSENEKGWNGKTIHNIKKTNFLLSLFQNAKCDYEKKLILQAIDSHNYFTENFMMFPISSKRMIVEISPFYKFRINNKEIYGMPNLEDLTEMPNEKLFYPNKNIYVYPQQCIHKYHPDDLYIYEIKKLTSKETRYCNALFLDRIHSIVGFTSLDKVVGSIIAYKKAISCPFVPRVDYTEMYKIINKRYSASLT